LVIHTKERCREQGAEYIIATMASKTMAWFRYAESMGKGKSKVVPVLN
jgi:hypothetical protein